MLHERTGKTILPTCYSWFPFEQENILRQSGFEKDLEEIRTHLDCCRGGKLRILLVFLLVMLDIMLNFFTFLSVVSGMSH